MSLYILYILISNFSYSKFIILREWSLHKVWSFCWCPTSNCIKLPESFLWSSCSYFPIQFIFNKLLLFYIILPYNNFLLLTHWWENSSISPKICLIHILSSFNLNLSLTLLWMLYICICLFFLFFLSSSFTLCFNNFFIITLLRPLSITIPGCKL